METSVIFMAVMTALLTKHSVAQTFKKQVLVSKASFINIKSLSFEISRYFFFVFFILNIIFLFFI